MQDNINLEMVNVLQVLSERMDVLGNILKEQEERVRRMQVEVDGIKRRKL